MVTPIIIGPTGLAYVRSRLSRGKTLSRLVVPAVVDDRFVALALAPEGVEGSRLQQFEVGGLSAPGSSRAVVVSLAEFVGSAVDSELIYVAENPLAQPADSSIRRMRSHLVFHDGEVYHVSTSAVASDRVAPELVIRESRAYGANGFILGNGSNMCIPADRADVSQSTLDVWAAHVESVFVSAYDGEGFIVACKAGSPVADLLQAAKKE